MEYLSLQTSSKEDYSTHGVVFLAACLERQMYHAWKFRVKVPMNTYPYENDKSAVESAKKGQLETARIL